MRNLTTLGHKINSKIGKAINEYQLIKDGDKILVAVSGGKDSLTLLKFLKLIQGWAPINFEILVAHIKTDFHCGSCVHNDVLEKIFNDLNIKFKILNIKVLDEKKTTSCFWCSWNRRKILFSTANQLKFNKVALGHHKDDIAETMLMNLLCNGEISTMNPHQEMFKGQLSIIRPLCFVEEKMIQAFALESDFPKQLCKCPFGKNSKRKLMKKFISEFEKKIPGTNVKTNIFKSLSRIKHEYIDLKESQ